MKRIHICVVVNDIEANIAFYTKLFGQPPTISERDYAKWQLDDPRVNFSVDAHGDQLGVDHLGIEHESVDNVQSALDQLYDHSMEVIGDEVIVCGYHKTRKGWVTDPQSVLWETFFSTQRTPHYGCANEKISDEVERRASEPS